MVQIRVKKRSGALEPFQLSKIEGAVRKAGGSVALAGEAALELGGWVKEIAKEGVITTVEIERKLVDFVATKNADVAKAMGSFVKKV